ncbi:DUF979 domain-containing protein [Sandaracinobacter neustonicus]|uniref:DUF979 domain-containing protein n=1 Tax=Sandaracinobacter neustonicus TaxID=1715348 RepID=A0A501XM21_9SPHN|nr:DUF979 domain-containing protein [Sandaracinobacter neustonicus]TPE61732.1 DUF979 domain-containing protein [Sandaracinobacter neustonicus]
MITLDHAYLVTGLMFAAFAILSLGDMQNPARARNALFWGLVACSLLFGSYLGDFGNGLLVIALVGIGAFGRLGVGKPATTSTEERRAGALHFGNRLFVPALMVPLFAVGGTLLAKHTAAGRWLISDLQTTLIALGIGCLAALTAAMLWFRPPALAPLQEGRRLMDSIGWAALLPQMLASLGAVFLAADVGQVVGDLIARAIPMTSAFLAVFAYCLGMALFTIVMGNAFAAFPVMTAAIGLPFLVHKFGGDPAIVCAIGMLAGFCGTLMTPMAANFNVVPANLLELPDRDAPLNGVIRAQIPTALIMLVANMVLMYVLAFR